MKMFFSLLLLCAGLSLSAQNEEHPLVQAFFETYEEDSMKALDDIFATNSWFAGNQDAIKNVKFKLREFINLVGEYTGYELINSKSFGESLRKETYMVKYERQPIRFEFEFYKPKDKWMLNNFYFSENMEDEK